MKILHIPTGQICYWTPDTYQVFPYIVDKKNLLLLNDSLRKYITRIDITPEEFETLINCIDLRVFVSGISDKRLYPNDRINRNDKKLFSFTEFTLIE